MSHKHAFLILTQHSSGELSTLYDQLRYATAASGDLFILYHKRGEIPPDLFQYPYREFTDQILSELSYQPIQHSLLPGSNHFPLLQFYRDNPGYAYYWCIEDDVTFNGRWSDFFSQFDNNLDHDLVSSHVEKYNSSNADWPWWTSLKAEQETFNNDQLVRSFNPIYRISNRALQFIHAALQNGKYCGHHEVLLPTLLLQNGFSVMDFGGEGEFVPPAFKHRFYNIDTLRWRPVFRTMGNARNMIYHPVTRQAKTFTTEKTINWYYRLFRHRLFLLKSNLKGSFT